MKKLICALAAASISSTPVMAVVSCEYIDTIQKSIENKINVVAKNTSHYFKGAILANTQDFNGQSVDSYIRGLKVGELTGDNTDLNSVTNIFNTFLDTKQTSSYIKEVYTRDEFNKPNQTNPLKDKLNVIQKAYNEVYRLLGVKMDPYVWKAALPPLMKDLDAKTILSMISFGEKMENSLSLFNDVNVPNYNKLIKMGVTTNSDLKLYFSAQLSYFLISCLSTEIKIEEFDFNKSNSTKDFYEYNKNLWAKLFKKDDQEKSPSIKFEFNKDKLGYLFNFIFGMSWYIQNFTKGEYDLLAEDMIDENHIFSKSMTNLEVFAEVNSKKINKNIVDAPNMDGALQFFYDLFSGEKDKNDYKLLRTFKILFQVDDDILEENEKLNFNNKVLSIGSKTLDLNIGEWQNNGFVENNGALNTFLSSMLNGALTGLASGIDTDGGIFDFLNKIGMGPNQISGIISGLISSTLSGIDMDNFFENLVDDLSSSLHNIQKWNGLIINEDLKGKIENIHSKVQTLKPMIKKLIDLNITNKFAGFLVNTSFRQLIKMFGFEDSFPVEMPNISIKDIINIPLINGYKLSDLLTLGTKGLSVIITILAKGVAPKLTRLAIHLKDDSLSFDSEFEIHTSIGNEKYSIRDLVNATISNDKDKDKLIIKKDDKEGISTLALASILQHRATGIKIKFPGENKFGFQESTILSASDASKWMMGLGIVNTNGTRDPNKFRENTILGELSTFWEDETGAIIHTLFDAVDQLLKFLNSMIIENEKQNYLPALNSKYFTTKIISYTNFKDSTKESKLHYQITYSDSTVTRVYDVELILPIKKANDNDVKYQIEYFGLNK